MEIMRSNLLDELLKASDEFSKFGDLEKIIEQKGTLTHLPIYPIYLAIHAQTPIEASAYLPYMSTEQRQTLIDLDSWNKDQFDDAHFSFWLPAYAYLTLDDIKSEFVFGSTFLFYLKGRFTISTFDTEDPQYPEHDSFFVTDDQLLLFEFEEHFPYVDEIKQLIRHIYAQKGVEEAYSYLFKMVVDSATVMEEDEYQKRKSRLAEYGITDYYDALEIYQPFASIKKADQFILTQKGTTAEISEWGQNEVLPSMTTLAYKKRPDLLTNELMKIDHDSKRKEYLKFNFIRLLNASLSYTNSLHEGSMAINRLGEQTKSLIYLGFDYVKQKRAVDDPLFFHFTFTDLFKIGRTLIAESQKSLKSQLLATPFHKQEKEYFLGTFFQDLLQETFLSHPTWKEQPIDNKEAYNEWNELIEFLIQMLPYIQKFYTTLQTLIDQQKIHNNFYINYQIDTIDFESILISSFANFHLKIFNPQTPKMGLTLPEFKAFLHSLVGQEGKCLDYHDKNLLTSLSHFKQQFGFASLSSFENYLYTILKQQLEGYDLHQLKEEDFKHVGGAIILAL